MLFRNTFSLLLFTFALYFIISDNKDGVTGDLVLFYRCGKFFLAEVLLKSLFLQSP